MDLWVLQGSPCACLIPHSCAGPPTPTSIDQLPVHIGGWEQPFLMAPKPVSSPDSPPGSPDPRLLPLVPRGLMRESVSPRNLGGARGKEPACRCWRHMRRVRFLDREDPLEAGMATHSCLLAWRIPWTGEPGGLQSMGHSHTRLKRLSTHAQRWTRPTPSLRPEGWATCPLFFPASSLHLWPQPWPPPPSPGPPPQPPVCPLQDLPLMEGFLTQSRFCSLAPQHLQESQPSAWPVRPSGLLFCLVNHYPSLGS